jgi:hypothetical protein
VRSPPFLFNLGQITSTVLEVARVCVKNYEIPIPKYVKQRKRNNGQTCGVLHISWLVFIGTYVASMIASSAKSSTKKT